VLVLLVEIEAQRREIARLMNALGERTQPTQREREDATSDGDFVLDDRLLLSTRDLRKAPGVAASTLYRWMNEGAFAAQIHVGSLALAGRRRCPVTQF
jgi:hypothetical protein